MINTINQYIARLFAIVGGAILIGVAVITTSSVIGRATISIGGKPISGDFELVEVGVGIAIFCFLPIAVVQRAHASVDILQPLFSERINGILETVIDILFAAMFIVFTWRTYLGMLSKWRTGDTTFILQIPLWMPYSLALFVLFFTSIVALGVITARAVEFVRTV